MCKGMEIMPPEYRAELDENGVRVDIDEHPEL